jgi:hypothetical protein
MRPWLPVVMWGGHVCADQELARIPVRGLSLLICIRWVCFVLHERKATAG